LSQVREVAVIGLPDPRWGERPVAIVVLADGTTLELPALTDHCRTRLAGFKIPKQLIIRDSLPRNPSGKVLKRVLRAELEAQHDPSIAGIIRQGYETQPGRTQRLDQAQDF